MATFERQLIKGWRSLREEAGAKLEHELWRAPSRTIYYAGIETADADSLLGHAPWCRQIYGPERDTARALLATHRAAKRQSDKAEESEEQREQRRERQRKWRATLSPDQVQKFKAAALARISRHEPEWHDLEREKRRQRKDAKREQYNATDRLSSRRRSAARNERKREVYAMNPDYFCEKERARRTANPEHVRAMDRAAYARRKASK